MLVQLPQTWDKTFGGLRFANPPYGPVGRNNQRALRRMILEQQNGMLHAIPTGEKGSAQQLEPQADLAIIDELVKAASVSLDSIT